MIRVLVAEDHAIFRQGLRRLFEFAGDISIAGEARNGREVLDCVGKEHCDLLLLDMSMPCPSGIELIKRVRSAMPGLPILVLSVHEESELASRAIRAGAAGYLTKDGEPDQVLHAIRMVARGGRAFAPAIAAQVAYERLSVKAPAHRLLSDREFQVFGLLANGLSIPMIAEQLHISPKTVSTHKFRLLQKLCLRTEADLVRYALKHRLVS